MKIYLAHGTGDKARGLLVQKELEAMGFQVLNPFSLVPQKSANEYMVEHELRMIESCDVLVAIITKETRAAHMEVFYAARILHRPVFVVYEAQKDTGRLFHPWYDYLTRVFPTVDSMLAGLKIWMDKQ